MSDAFFNEAEMLEEHLAEKAIAEAKAAAEKEAADAAQHIKWSEERRAENLARNRAKSSILVSIAGALVAQGAKVDFDVDTWKLDVNGIGATYYFSVEEEWTNDRWRSKRTGKYRVAVEVATTRYNRNIGRNVPTTKRKSFPPRKVGHNYAAIAEAILDNVNRRIAEAKAETARKRNLMGAKELATELGLPEYTSLVRASTDPKLPVVVNLKEIYSPIKTMSVDDARKLLLGLRALGLKLDYNG